MTEQRCPFCFNDLTREKDLRQFDLKAPSIEGLHCRACGASYREQEKPYPGLRQVTKPNKIWGGRKP